MSNKNNKIRIDSFSRIDTSNKIAYKNKTYKEGTFPEIDNTYTPFSGISIFKIFIIIIIFVVFYRFITYGEYFDFSFKSLIEIFVNAPAIEVAWSNVNLSINGDLGVFNFIKIIWNPIATVYEFFVSLIGMLWQGLHFLMYFLRVLIV